MTGDEEEGLKPLGIASAQVFDAIMETVGNDLAQRVQAKTSAMLDKLIPDDAPHEIATAVLAGMVAGVLLEFWERSVVDDPAERVEAMAAMMASLARDYAGQFKEMGI